MPLEVEQKFWIDDATVLARRLDEIGAKPGPPLVQADEYFAHPCRDFAHTDEALRIRAMGQSYCLTYKGPKLDPQTKTRRELEIPLSGGPEIAQQFRELIVALGFRPVAVVRKDRRAAHVVFNGFDVNLALDDVPPLGRFVELEISAADAVLEPAQQALHQLAEQLGLTRNERRSYLELLLQRAENPPV
jgi:adenylate cyclase class 2